MRNVKFISLFAACGFVLSFVFGLFSHSSFISILLKALIFGVCFVVLGFLISFIYDKFLNDAGSDVFTSTDFSETSGKNNFENAKVGQHVDIVIQDEELPDSEGENHFVVGDNHQMLKATDIKEDNTSSAVDIGDNTSAKFVPLRDTENAQNFSGTEPKRPAETAATTDETNVSDEDLDTLPDMESLTFSDGNESGEINNESFNDSGLISSATSFKKSDGNQPDVKDASLIAKAISTALAEEDS